MKKLHNYINVIWMEWLPYKIISMLSNFPATKPSLLCHTLCCWNKLYGPITRLHPRICMWENILRKYTQKLKSGLLLCNDRFEYQSCSSLAAGHSASTLRLFWHQSQLLNVADNAEEYSLLLQILLSLPKDIQLRHMNTESKYVYQTIYLSIYIHIYISICIY